MKFYINIIIGLSIAYLLFSCKKVQNVATDNLDFILIDGKKLDTVIPDTTIIDTLWTVQLETNDDILIKHCYRIIVHDQKIIILDRDQQVVFIFNMKGHFLAKIDKQGKGPGEYISVEGMHINNDGLIVLHDASNKKNLLFNTNGEYVDENNTYVEIFNNQMEIANGDYIYYTGKKNNQDEEVRNSSITIVSDNKLNCYLPNKNDVRISIQTTDSYLFRGGNKIYFFKPFGAIIYQVTNEHDIVAKYGINFKYGGLPPDVYQTCLNTKNFIEKYWENDNYLLVPGSITATRKYLSIPVVSAVKMQGFVFYSIKTRKTIQARGFRTPHFNFPINFARCTYGDTLISVIDDYYILLNKEHIDYSDKNPVLVFYTLLDF